MILRQKVFYPLLKHDIFSWQIYTIGKNVAQMPVVMVGTKSQLLCKSTALQMEKVRLYAVDI